MAYSDIDGGVAAVFMRGGTSKGLIVHERDLPPAGDERDALLMRLMGTPDPLQIDGMGGAASSTSKVMVVSAAGQDGVIEYSFGQVGIAQPVVDWRGNCGNLSFAVAAFAVDSGLSPVDDGATETTVRLRNTNTGVRIDAEVAVRRARAARDGDTVIAGVPGTAAPITMRYLEPGGAVTGALLPLVSAQTMFTVATSSGELRVRGTLVDATNPYLFVARDAVPGAHRAPAELRGDETFLAVIERLRAAAAVALGVASSLEAARIEAPVTPRIVLVGPPKESAEADLETLTISMQQVHRGIPMTAAMALAAARGIAGSIVHDLVGDAPANGATVIAHPLGTVRVVAEHAERADGTVHVVSVGVTGTTRTLMAGMVYPAP
ncbi:PrpF domain-containing protein [Leucobacter chinensis]|uniref:PrpF domain-containing protein n=1 Tax=Leucobacter chinensis TaxID=2851010 RepID=UPI001C221DE3